MFYVSLSFTKDRDIRPNIQSITVLVVFDVKSNTMKTVVCYMFIATYVLRTFIIYILSALSYQIGIP